MKKIKIKGKLAHFKIPIQGKLQRTTTKPQISTVLGILENIYGKGIDDFKVGFICKYRDITREFNNIYKEVDGRENKYTCNRRFKKDNFITEYLVDTELIIYTDIEREIVLDEPLVLGKANCLGTIVNIQDGDFQNIELKNKMGCGYNQWTSLEIGTGMPTRINTITKFNTKKSAYDYKMKLVRDNMEFDYSKFYDEEEEENIFLWEWKKGEINEVK